MATKEETTLSTDQQAVATVVRDEVAGMLSKDIEKLKQVLAPDARLFHLTGKEESREEWLNQIKLGRMRYLANQEVKLAVNISPDGQTASAVCDNRLKARIYGFTNTWPLESTMKLRKHNGQWQIVEAKTTMF